MRATSVDVSYERTISSYSRNARYRYKFEVNFDNESTVIIYRTINQGINPNLYIRLVIREAKRYYKKIVKDRDYRASKTYSVDYTGPFKTITVKK